MVGKPVDVLERTLSTALRWPGAQAPNHRIRPDDSPNAHPASPSSANGARVLSDDGPPPGRAARNPALHGRHGTKAENARLAGVIEAEVVPRLVLAGRAAGCDPAADRGAAAPGPEDVVALVGLVIADDAAAPLAYVDGLRARGVTLERLYLDLFAVVAQRLGQLWTEDLCSFADVTVGLVRLQNLVREYSPAFLPPLELSDPRRRALLVPVPGEQHTFGLVMVAEFFLRAGWDVHSNPLVSAEELSSTVRNRWYAVVGISVGNDDRLDGIAALVRRVRRDSCNRGIGVMVGGRVFAERPELAGMVGADATATDGRQAALQAETLLALLAKRN